jgi:hypothetical protein
MESINKRIVVQVSQGIETRPYSKITKAKRASGMSSVLEYLEFKPQHHQKDSVPSKF